jgi:hypothetical protein
MESDGQHLLLFHLVNHGESHASRCQARSATLPGINHEH